MFGLTSSTGRSGPAGTGGGAMTRTAGGAPPRLSGGRRRNVLRGLGRAVKMGQHDQKRCQNRPTRSGREGDQRKSAAGCNSGTEPPELAVEQRRGFASGQVRRQSQARGDRECRKSGQAPKEPLPPTDLAATQR